MKILKGAGLLFLITSAILLCGCINGGQKKETLNIAGSTTVQPIASKAAEEFMKKNPDVIVSVQGGGSSTGIKMVVEGSADIGAISRELKDSEKEKYPNLKPVAIALDSIVVVVHPDNLISDLTKQQVQDIFSGGIKNFKEVGGDDREILVVIRERGSGTRTTFEELVMDGGKITNAEGASQNPSNGAVKAVISGNENAIGYLGIGYIDETVKAIKIDGTMSSEETIRSGEYPISRKLYMITKGEATGLKKKFIDFVLSEEGQQIVEKEGFIRVR